MYKFAVFLFLLGLAGGITLLILGQLWFGIAVLITAAFVSGLLAWRQSNREEEARRRRFAQARAAENEKKAQKQSQSISNRLRKAEESGDPEHLLNILETSGPNERLHMALVSAGKQAGPKRIIRALKRERLFAYRGFLCKVLGEVKNPEAIPNLLRLIHEVPSFHDSTTLAAREALTAILRQYRVIDNQLLSAINGSYKTGGLSISNTNSQAHIIISLLETCLPELYQNHQDASIRVFRDPTMESEAVAQIAEAMGKTKDKAFLTALHEKLEELEESDLRQKNAITKAIAKTENV